MGAGGIVLRFFNLAIRVLQFLASAVILGIYSYFLAKLAHHDLHIPTWMKAVEGLSGAATLYSLIGSLLTCCLGGFTFFAAIAIILDVCFVGAMIAIAILTRDGTNHCSGVIDTRPVGTGRDGTDSPAGIDYGYACMLEKVVFAVSIIGIFFFLISILFQFLLGRHHRREKRFGPSPTNGYTYGTQKRGFWRRNKAAPEPVTGDNMLPAHPTPHDMETGPTAAGAGVAPAEKQGWFNRFGRRNEPVDGAVAAPAPGYGGTSAYTGNY
ncbi:uncharacterized protein DSM5745_01568 [Aspergillus mulundensis]|uniref:MARVEL domain-containing protein n=1 Tax=Aspergillus mulundensis TaxID=1810919 RepID=A0A3D8SU01_9EURO|nr:Uncharacterized protein DSM5745_01568 [Aspergillus mulundensis]RDW89793.1 Uncharacterized protein DSM5745_01568 [Aspergillus mulundensis]